MATNEDPFFKLGLFSLVVGGSVLARAIHNFKEAIEVSDMPTSPIKSAAQGTVEFQGWAWPVKPLVLPLGKKPVVYYELIVEEYRSQGKTSSWVEIFKDESNMPFAVVDKTGFATVIPTHLELQVTQQIVDHSSLPMEDRLTLQSYCSGHGTSLNLETGLFHSNKRVLLRCLEIGSPVYALGLFDTKAEQSSIKLRGGVVEFFNEIATIGRNPVFDLKKYDVNHDGMISENEWRAAYSSIAGRLVFPIQKMVVGERVMSTDTTAPDETREPYSLCAGFISGDPQRKLLLADCHQQELLKRLKNYNSLKVVASALLIALGVALIIFSFHVKVTKPGSHSY